MAVQTRIKLRRATAAVWGNVNPVLALGEPGFEVDTNKLKIGNGTDAWSVLSYASGGASVEVGTAAPVDAEPNTLWWNSETGGLYILYGSTWVDASPAVAGPQGIQGVQGPQGEQGPIGLTGPAGADGADGADGASGKLAVASVSSNITLAVNTRYLINTSAARTLTLPASPALGDEIQILDAIGTAGTNVITIANNSHKINGVLDSALLDANGVAASFVYTGTTYGWRMG